MIFELFTQDQRTLDRSEGGLGLGLALVRRLVELHGGRVECTSAGQGKGSTFTVCLPRQGRREELRATDSHPAAAKVAPTSFLVVEDNHDSAETMAALLELDGHRVRVAFDGRQALDLALHEAPRVVLLDIGLPGLSGLEVARRMRATPSLADTMIIGMSGYAQAGDRTAAGEAGFDAHLAKPAEVSDVYRAIEQLRT